MKKLLQNGVVKATGKVLALMGVSLTFAACYGPMPPDGCFPYPLDSAVVMDQEDKVDAPVGEAAADAPNQVAPTDL